MTRYLDETSVPKLTVSSDSGKTEDLGRSVRPTDETVIKVFYTDPDRNQYTAVRVSADTPAAVVLKTAAKKMPSEEVGNIVLAEIKSNGGKEHTRLLNNKYSEYIVKF